MASDKRIYFDRGAECVGVAVEGRQVVYTGLTVHREPAKERDAGELKPLQQEDFHFFFEDEEPQVELYGVPELMVIGYDSAGGYFATTERNADFGENFPLYYISGEKKLYAVEGESRQLLTGRWAWREKLRPSDAAKLYPSRAAAEQEVEIHDLEQANLSGLPGGGEVSLQAGENLV